MLDGIAPALAFGFIAGVMPGPLQSFLLLQSLRRGVRGGLWVLPAPLLSDGPIIAVCLLVLSRAGEGLLRTLAACGGAFLAYLAWESWRGLRRAGADERVESLAARDGWALLRRAAVINGLGPGPWVFWGTVMGPLLVRLWRQSPGRGLAFLALFYGTFLAILVVQTFLFSTARRLGPRIVRGGAWLGIALLAAFAVLLLLYGAGVTDRHGL